MKILYITQHFPPEIGAAPVRAYDMALELNKLGNDLIILTTFPNNIPKTLQFYKKEVQNELIIHRTFRLTDLKTSAKRRLGNYLTFAFSSFIAGLFIRKPDLIYATTPQLFQALTGFLLSRFHRTPFVLEVRDLWVDFAEILGQFNNKKLLRMARKLEGFLYERADMIVTVTHGYKRQLVKQGLPSKKIIVIPNGVHPTTLKTNKTKRNIRKEYKIPEEDLLILYTGNLGVAQELDTVLSAAKELENIEVTFLFIGEGVAKETLERKAKQLNLTNTIFLNPMPKESLSDFYSSADLGLVSLKDHPLFSITIPSKLFDYLANSLPVLNGVQGEVKDIVEELNAGYNFEASSTTDLVKTILLAITQKEQLNNLRHTLQSKIMNKFNREKLAKQLNNELQKKFK